VLLSLGLGLIGLGLIESGFVEAMFRLMFTYWKPEVDQI